MQPTPQLEERWIVALELAYLAAKAEVDAYLNGTRDWWDRRGLHTFSVECGRVLALQELVPELGHAEFNPKFMYSDARREVVREWRSRGRTRGAPTQKQATRLLDQWAT